MVRQAAVADAQSPRRRRRAGIGRTPLSGARELSPITIARGKQMSLLHLLAFARRMVSSRLISRASARTPIARKPRSRNLQNAWEEVLGTSAIFVVTPAIAPCATREIVRADGPRAQAPSARFLHAARPVTTDSTTRRERECPVMGPATCYSSAWSSSEHGAHLAHHARDHR